MQISYIGMQTQEVAIKPNLKVVLRSDAQQIDEVVVTAMGIKRSEKALGYAATSVGGEKIAESRTSDVMSSLAGKIAGVQISSTSSDPGASNSVIIRGVSSLSGTNQPLYVVDGVPLNNSTVYSTDGLNSGYDFGNGANAINPDDVANMTILKGAAATALYGSRAANGVVMITTKSGRKEKGVGIEYNGGVQWSTVLRLPEFQNEFGMGWNGNHTELENGSWGPRFDGSMQLWGNVYNNSQKLKPYVAMPDNIKDFFDAGFRYSNSLSFNGATDKSDYYVSFSQISDDGMIPTDADSYDKYTFSARGSHKAGALTFSSSLNYAYQKNNFATTGQGLSMLNSLYQTPRDISIIGLEDQNDPFNTPGYYYTPYGVMNPYYILNNYLNEYESERFYGKFQLDYEFLKYFKFTYRMGLDTTTGQSDKGKPNLYALYYEGTPNGEGQGSSSPFSGETGQYSEQITRRREINQDIMVNFNMPVNDFNINALVGFNGNERKVSYQYSEVNDLTIPTWFNLKNSGKTPIVEQHMELRRLMGVFGQFEGSWKNMLYLTVTARNDWSSTLAYTSHEKSGFFYPSVGFSLIFNKLMTLPQWVSLAKIRGAYSMVGNDIPMFITNPSSHITAGGEFLASDAAPFKDMEPEMTHSFEAGIEARFLKNRIGLNATFYKTNTRNQFFKLPTLSGDKYAYRYVNAGDIQNVGWEISLDAVPLLTNHFKWKTEVNFSTNRNKIISLHEALKEFLYGPTSFSSSYAMKLVKGGSIGDIYGKAFVRDDAGNIVYGTEGDNTGMPLVEGDGNTVKVGNANPKLMLGWNHMLSYKNFSFYFLVDCRFGGDILSQTQADMDMYGVSEVTARARDKGYVMLEGNRIDNVKGFYKNVVGGRAGVTEYYMYDATNIRLRELSVGYQLPAAWMEKTKVLKRAQLSFSGRNLFFFYKKAPFDPDLVLSTGNDNQGIEVYGMPTTRSWGFSLKCEF